MLAGTSGVHGRRCLEGLADFPGATELLGLALKVAAGHVEADAIAEDVVERLLDRNVRAALASATTISIS